MFLSKLLKQYFHKQLHIKVDSNSEEQFFMNFNMLNDIVSAGYAYVEPEKTLCCRCIDYSIVKCCHQLEHHIRMNCHEFETIEGCKSGILNWKAIQLVNLIEL